MHRAIISILSIAFVVACGNTPPSPTSTATSSSEPSAPAAPAVPDFKLSHFKFWKTSAQPLNGEVTVEEPGQQQWLAKLGEPEYLANPTLKTHNGKPYPIKNPRLHYVAYRVDSEHSRAPVRVLNQFTKGEERWELGRPSWLLVPASKAIGADPGPVPPAEHFVCYAIAKLPDLPTLTLQDQFDERRQMTEDVSPLRAAHFCVPVRKYHGNAPQVEDRTTGLAMYWIPRDRYAVDPTVRDQFHPAPFSPHVQFSEFLGVPSRFTN